MTNSERILKSRDITVDKAPYSQTMLFPVVMYGCDCKEGWLPKNWCFQTEVLEKTFESHLDNKDIKLVIPKGNQPWIFIGRTDTEAEAPIFWPPDEKSQLLGQNSCDRKDWRQKEKRVTEDEMVGWHDQLDGHEFEQTLGNSEEQEACHAAVHGAAKSQMRSSHWTMATMQRRICGSVKKVTVCWDREAGWWSRSQRLSQLQGCPAAGWRGLGGLYGVALWWFGEEMRKDK